MIEHLEALERYDIKNLMMMLPPGSAKSTYSSVLFPAWFMGRHPESMLILTSNTMELAETFGRRIRNIVGHADFKAEFGFGLSSDSTAAARWSNEKGGELLGAGVGGSIVGRRCDCLVMDDVVRSKEDVNSETMRERVWAWYTADVLTRLKPRARQVFCNTRWHEDDLAGRILDRDLGEWTVLKLEMENTRADDPLNRKVGDMLWPEWFTEDMVKRAKQDPASWSALYQQNPSPEGGGEFKKVWMEFYDTAPNPRNTTNLIIVDPANEKSRSSDFTRVPGDDEGQEMPMWLVMEMQAAHEAVTDLRAMFVQHDGFHARRADINPQEHRRPYFTNGSMVGIVPSGLNFNSVILTLRRWFLSDN